MALKTLTDILDHWAEAKPRHPALKFLHESSIIEELSYAQLRSKAIGLAAEIRAASEPGDRALLAFPPGLDFVVSFFACQYAGVIPVPCCLPRGSSMQQPIESIAESCRPKLLLTTAKTRPSLEKLQNQSKHDFEILEVDRLACASGASPGVSVTDEDIALLQYTSGSTSNPKGVMLRHRNLIANQEMIRESFGHQGEVVVVGWLPTYHDMGLIGNVIQPLWLGGTSILMSPLEFYFHPQRWLQAISRFEATTAGAPPWGYDWCTKKIAAKDVADLDLSHWRVVYVGAEPIQPGVVDAFTAKFGPVGFARRSFLPCYGLAEATLFVTGIQAGTGAESRWVHERQRVGVGTPRKGTRIKIVDPSSLKEMNEGQVGEILVAGPSVGAGYWDRPEATSEVFGATVGEESGFLRTGDLGCLERGNLFVTGRLKDVLIQDGRKFHAEDIEMTVRECGEGEPIGMVAAFSFEEAAVEKVAVAFELDRSGALDPINEERVRKKIRQRVRVELGLEVAKVVRLGRGSIPRTSSGKVRRAVCRDTFTAGGWA